MDEVQEQFEDPAFRRAVRQAVGKPAAPPRLRATIAAMMAPAGSAPAPRQPLEATPRSWRVPAPPAKIAAAAVLAFVALAFAFLQIVQEFELFAGDAVAAPSKFEATLASSMVRTHHDCAKRADHHLVNGNDFAALDAELSKAEGINVFAAPLGDGWQFKGAGHCRLGNVDAAHLLFVRGGEAVSVFSMPKTEAGCGGANYEQTVDGNVIVGFTKGNALYALVESRSDGKKLKPKHAKPLLAVVRQDVLGTSQASQPAQ